MFVMYNIDHVKLILLVIQIAIIVQHL